MIDRDGKNLRQVTRNGHEPVSELVAVADGREARRFDAGLGGHGSGRGSRERGRDDDAETSLLWWLRCVALLVVGRVREEEAAGGAADASAAGRARRRRASACAARAGQEPAPVPAEPRLRHARRRRTSTRSTRTRRSSRSSSPTIRTTIDAAGQQALNANAELMKKYPTWIITIEGHSDERGTAEYNLALGERRALAARNYLVSLGIPADRLRTVSYGKEFPFEPGPRRGCVVEEPPRPFRRDEQIGVLSIGLRRLSSARAMRAAALAAAAAPGR